MRVRNWRIFSVLTLTLWLGWCGAASAINPQVTAGANHSILLKGDGTLLAMGDDSSGQLGLGRLVQSATPIEVQGLRQVRAIAIGDSHTVALKQDGTVWTWGTNNSGQLGDGTNTQRTEPVKVMTPGFVTSVAAGFQHTVALTQDGNVLAWGANGYGEIGDGTTMVRNSPVQVVALSGVVAIAAGRDHTVALKQDGSVWAWGNNNYGQLGDGTTTNRSLPIPVPGLSDVISISAGDRFTAALKKDGTVWTWGDNLDSELGDGTTSFGPFPPGTTIPSYWGRKSPGLVVNLSGVTAISCGGSFAMALKQDGTVWAWGGRNNPGVLGNGTNASSERPVQVLGLMGVTRISAGRWHTLALHADGTVSSWGVNYYGDLGNGVIDQIFPPTTYNTPTPVLGLSGASGVTAGAVNSSALRPDGTVLIWGSNMNGQLGNVTSTTRSTPSNVSTLTGIDKISAGLDFTMALKQDGTVWTWGDNFYGQLGDGTAAMRSMPVQVLPLSGVSAVAAGQYHSLALKQDGTVWAWGWNLNDQLGSGGTTQYLKSPVQVQQINDVSAIAAGSWYGHSLALKRDGSVWAWGDNKFGQLGDGTTTNRSLPISVPGLSSIVAIAAGSFFSLALKRDGTVWAWGKNDKSQLGSTSISICNPFGSPSPCSLNPSQIKGLSGVMAIAAGLDNGLALQQVGDTLLAWGSNADGQLGDGTTVNRLIPVQVASGVRSFAAGTGHIIVYKVDGHVLVLGRNSFGQLGDATYAQRRTPVLTVNSSGSDFLNLAITAINKIPPALEVPFFTVAAGGVTDTSASVSTNTKFNPADKGKSGSVYVTAMVPMGSLGAATIGDSPPNHVLAVTPPQATATSACPAPTNPLTLVQLTPTGWKTVVNGQLIAYASGVLGDQLAAQTILNNADTTNLKGAEFCVGYGTSAQDMVNNGNIRAVATIPGATTTSTCVVGSTLNVGLNVTPGWNLLGNPINQSITVATKFGDANKVSSVWKWDTVKANWQFYAPGMDSAALQSYATSHGYGVLTEISPGDGYWVQAKVQADLGSMCGTSINLRQSSLSSGWNLVSTASPISAKDFNLTLSTTPPTAGQVPINMTSLWAWDANQANWYFYAPVLDAQGGNVLTEYISKSNYKDFNSNGKTLGNGVGIWVNRP